MPIYEYEANEPSQGCATCFRRFEVLRRMGDPVLGVCPACGERFESSSPVVEPLSWSGWTGTSGWRTR